MFSLNRRNGMHTVVAHPAGIMVIPTGHFVMHKNCSRQRVKQD